MSNKPIHIVHLYPKEMNIYGDTGNRIILEKRLEWRGIPCKTSLIGVGDTIPSDADLIIGGGGQDAGQIVVQSDLKKKAKTIITMADDEVPMLMICGMYQLFGHEFITSDDARIEGIGLLPLYTKAGNKRLIGNIVIATQDYGKLVGYENHSGQTFMLEDLSLAFGVVESGYGNNGQDGTEGCHFKNVFAGYMHGPMLSKNPVFADALLQLALNRHSDTKLKPIDDSLENDAFAVALKRPQ